MGGEPRTADPMAGNDDDLALLIYTSGTTGRPKGVMLDNANLNAMCAMVIEGFELTDADHSLLILPLFHVNGIVVSVLSPLLAGFALAFARGIGEYGSVVFIAGNLPYETEIAPLLIMAKLESFDYPSAAAIAIVMMAASFLVLLALNGYQRWRMHHQGV